MQDITLNMFYKIINSDNIIFKDYFFGDNFKTEFDSFGLFNFNKYVKTDKDKLIHVSFINCTFDLSLHFTNLIFHNNAQLFKNCVFNNEVYFGNMTFGNLMLEEVVFNKACYFYSCTFIEGLQFFDTTFNGPLLFDADKTHRITEIEDAYFDCYFNGKTNFKSVIFNKANFSKSIVGEKVFELSNCSFTKLGNFRGMNLKSNVAFINIDLSNCTFLNSEFVDARFLSSPISINNYIDINLFSKSHKDNHEEYKELGIYMVDNFIAEVNVENLIVELKTFERNFDKIKRFEIAGKFHQKSLEIERKYNSKWFKKSVLYLYRAASSYGESYSRTLILFSIVLLFFSLLYLITGLTFIENDKYSVIYYFKGSNIYNIINDYGLSFLFSFINSFPVKREISYLISSNGYTTFFSSLETIIQSILITLFIMALRRKFKR
jgi:uncharacterized protein YjbI with pentapeptide repeats